MAQIERLAYRPCASVVRTHQFIMGFFLEHSRAVSTRLMCVEPRVHSVLFTAAVRRPSTAVITLSDKIKFHNW